METEEKESLEAPNDASETESDDLHSTNVSAEQRSRELALQLAQEREHSEHLSGQLAQAHAEQELIHKLSEEGVIDIEAAVLLARQRMADDSLPDVGTIVEQLKTNKAYLFKKDIARDSNIAWPNKTRGIKSKKEGAEAILAGAAKKAASSGSRADLQEYLRLRRNYL